MKIRKAWPGESPKIVAVEKDAGEIFRQIGMGDIVDHADEVMTDDMYAEFIEDGDVFVAVDEQDEPVGFATMGQMDGEAYLVELSVHRSAQGKGLGRKLINAAIDWAKKRGDKTLLLSTFRDVPWNGPYYERLGFVILEERDCQRPDMQRQRTMEAKGGLDMTRRVFMRKPLT